MAALTLQVNTDNKTMAFVGSFDGTIEDSGGGNYIISFQNLNAGVYGNEDGYLTGVSDALKFVVSGGEEVTMYMDFTSETENVNINLSMYTQLGGADTISGAITGTGTFISYAGLGADGEAQAIERFEALIGQDLSMGQYDGSGFGSIRIEKALTVPEPSTYALIAGAAVLVVAFFVRRCRRSRE
ncbi:PEP-CTERM sorting domain-containing protein [Ruficoccus sp. ZRK36]|uniref:PEP-CTERM sorting domain-containing protein n=1 Tax=Ruficoccus sp. ZRK36 TaxID=2866311 RepID=UPI001C733ED8|nr:PEP-CTERM sorting domain-containing protein [Ruficoccus sp. ZRK36]QYY35565.1 PEP-CTERM sorting domain-containing protein [Ruficoccus sp. ZRK36]